VSRRNLTFKQATDVEGGSTGKGQEPFANAANRIFTLVGARLGG
jgi:hypothetical protein